MVAHPTEEPRIVKLSISVPDALWDEVNTQDGSPSQIVQEALGLLAAHKRGGEQRILTSAESRLRKTADREAGWIEEKLDGLQANASALRDTGYRMGIEVCTDLHWLFVEGLPGARELREALLDWARSGEEGEELRGLGDRLYQCLSDWEVGLNEAGEPMASPSLYDGMAAAFDDVRDAIRERLRRDAEGEQL